MILILIYLLKINKQSAYLIGRERSIVDIPIDHPSCSKQHAVIQHRHIIKNEKDGKVKTLYK